MKNNRLVRIASGIALASTFAISAYAATPASSAAPALTNQTDQISYIIGYNLGQSFKQQSISINNSVLNQGLNDGLQGNTPALTQDQMQQIMQNFQKQLAQKYQQQQAEMATKNQASSDAYLAKVSTESGVVQLQKGLYYKVIKQGNGPMPKATDTVEVNYKGTLPDGTVFDSSYARNQPATFPLNQVIPGWTAALQKMPVGSTWMIYIAPDLGYGKFAPPSIGPNQALTFQVELLAIKSSATQK
jgi:FKBP-type peptidyl-prolyl cis-trans isomerase